MTNISLMLCAGSAAIALALPAAAQNLPAGKNKEMVEKICAGCHELSLLTDRGRSKDDWIAVVKSMIDMGADIKPDQVAAITDYLASALPPRQGAAELPRMADNSPIAKLTKVAGAASSRFPAASGEAYVNPVTPLRTSAGFQSRIVNT
jgi:hypothetical protein